MPTPFYHLSVAYELLVHPSLSGKTRQFLHQQRPAFLLGKTAPDVQVMTGQAREETHFYNIPLRDPTPAWQRLLEAYPEFVSSSRLKPPQAAFLAGYLCHLQADLRWLLEVFNPYFGPAQSWETFRRRLTLHNILRSYLDQQLIGNLPDDTGKLLEAASIQGWLPFVEDEDLRRWRDFLADQLKPGSEIQTVAVFAARQGLTVDEFHQILSSEAQMESLVFARIPRQVIAQYRERLVEENLRFLGEYLAEHSELKDLL